MSYCEFCGTEIKDGEKCTCPQAKEVTKKSPPFNKRNLISIILAAMIVVAIIIACIVNAGMQKDPFDYINVSFSGINTKGTVSVSFDKSSLVSSLVGEAPDINDFSDKSLKEYLQWEEKYYNYQDNIKLAISKEDNLSNGEEIVISVTATGDAAKYIKSSEKTYTVSGLTEIKNIDAFRDIEVVFEGIDGEGKLRIVNNSTDPFVSEIDFAIDSEKSTNSNNFLSNGDKVVVIAKYDENLAYTYCCIPEQNEKSFTVSSLAKPVEAEDITIEFINQLKQVSYEILEAYEQKNSNEYDFNNKKYECVYFFQNEEQGIYHSPDNPKKRIVVFFSLERTNLQSTETKTLFCGVSFSSLAGEMVLYPNGTYKIFSYGSERPFDVDAGTKTGWEESLENAITSIHPLFEDETYYTRTKID
ncbi:MAG: hypothetical protein IKB86_05240 [Clostridia bacterium]|nr:hypothetical protein [Clostridia bacterium]